MGECKKMKVRIREISMPDNDGKNKGD